jgi:hypothetical protein
MLSDDAPRGQTPPPSGGDEPSGSPPARKMPSFWWALIALVSPMLVNMLVFGWIGGKAEVVAFFSTFLGPIFAGLVCRDVIGPRILV